MKSFLRNVRRLVYEDGGSTSVEYAMMLFLIVVACYVSVSNLGTNLTPKYEQASTILQ